MKNKQRLDEYFTSGDPIPLEILLPALKSSDLAEMAYGCYVLSKA